MQTERQMLSQLRTAAEVKPGLEDSVMKKLLAVLLAAVLILCLAACVNNDAEDDSAASDGDSAESPQSPTKDSDTSDLPLVQEQPADQTEQPTDETEPVPDETDAYEIWASLVGYWNAAERSFFVLDMQDSHSAVYFEGLWETDYGSGYGNVTELYYDSGVLIAFVNWPAQEETEMFDAKPEHNAVIKIDLSDREQDGKIRITDMNGETRQCVYAGAMQEEAYETFLTDQSGA